ncbi:hypothetical protein G7009_17940 [Pseudomonas capeferrum]|jgi:hypothetical protein|uniref:hypothetical protein n=1 Tax=Pseudomonas TaxID=286 RepID=UPI0015E30C3A|nr:hypothetical protein [Pseudomonas capeferrum]MBA1203606.1 hypothetical protein [Pseudomonas capeferrum]
MIKSLNRRIAKKIHAVIMMAPLKREMMRLGVCCLFAIGLNIILFFGVADDGTIKPWAERPLKLFASATLFLIMVKVVLPLLAWTILKAVLLSANNAFSGILGFLGNQVTGALYCTGIVLGSIVLKQYNITGILDAELAFIAACVFVSGFLWFFIFQCAIQNTMNPALRTPAVPRKNIKP